MEIFARQGETSLHASRRSQRGLDSDGRWMISSVSYSQGVQPLPSGGLFKSVIVLVFAQLLNSFDHVTFTTDQHLTMNV